MTEYLAKRASQWLLPHLAHDQGKHQLDALTLVLTSGLSSAALIVAWILYNHR